MPAFKGKAECCVQRGMFGFESIFDVFGRGAIVTISETKISSMSGLAYKHT